MADTFIVSTKRSKFEQKILHSTDQATIKKLGRMVKNFRQDVWDQNKLKIIKEGNIAKFSQNQGLKDYLLKTTGNLYLVEASPYDVIYGVGLSAESPDIYNPHKWRGQNLLGFTLMEVPQENMPIAQHTPSSKPKERSFVYGGNEYTMEVLLQSETISVFCKDVEDEVSYVKDKYGRFWLYCAHIKESHDSTLIYYSLVNSEEEARELAQNGDYFYRRKMPFFSLETKEDTFEFQTAVRRN